MSCTVSVRSDADPSRDTTVSQEALDELRDDGDLLDGGERSVGMFDRDPSQPAAAQRPRAVDAAFARRRVADEPALEAEDRDELRDVGMHPVRPLEEQRAVAIRLGRQVLEHRRVRGTRDSGGVASGQPRDRVGGDQHHTRMAGDDDEIGHVDRRAVVDYEEVAARSVAAEDQVVEPVKRHALRDGKLPCERLPHTLSGRRPCSSATRWRVRPSSMRS
jgi:hypothetical protein